MLSDSDAIALANPETGCPSCKIIIDGNELQATAAYGKLLYSPEVAHATAALCQLNGYYLNAIQGDDDLRDLASRVGLTMHDLAKTRALINDNNASKPMALSSYPSVNAQHLSTLEGLYLELANLLIQKGLTGYK